MYLLSLFKKYLQTLKQKPSDATVKNYVLDVKKFITWFEDRFKKEFRPEEVNPEVINEFKVSKASEFSIRSIERHLSSLRKFFQFLKLEGYISSDPFEVLSQSVKPANEDPWNLKGFKNYLYVYNASHLTIKNYIIDVRQFIDWAQKVGNTSSPVINTELVEEYKDRLYKEKVFSPASINRKLSSLRKYIAWAVEQGLVEKQILGTINSIKDKEVTSGALEKILEQNPNDIIIAEKKPEVLETELASYSSFPPIRLLQKVSRGITKTSDTILITPIISLLKLASYKSWVLQGKPLFISKKSPIQKSFVDVVTNLPKALYAPYSISLTNLPWYRKVIFHIRFTRPNWYKRYHTYAIAHYFHWAALFVITTALGFGIYSAFVGGAQKSPTLAAAPVAPPRILSFQGRLTDSNDNPITSGKNLRFAIYNDSSASGSALLWQEVDYLTPDTDGIFQTLLGNVTTIPQSLFAQNATLYLGITVENTAELTPRQQIATVPYATNAEVLQGMPPTTDAGQTTNTNTILALNSSGTLSIAGSATTTFQSTGGQLTLTGKTLSLTSASGTNTNVQLIPDGQGLVDIQKPIQNTTLNTNIRSGVNGAFTAAGAVEFDDLVGILATSSGQSAFTVDQDGTGPVISASRSGIAVFTIDGSGNETITGNLTLPNSNTITGVANFAQFSNGVSVGGGTTYFINQNTSSLNSLQLAGNLYMPVSGGIADFWQLASNVIAPSNTINDLVFGGNSTASAKFHVFGATGNTLIGSSATSALATLDVRGTDSTTPVASLSGATGKATLIIDQSGIGDIFTASQSGGTRFVIAKDGTLTDSKYTVDQGILFGKTSGVLTQTAAPASAGLCLQSAVSGGTPTWASCSSGSGGGNSPFKEVAASGLIVPINTTEDFVIGGTATTSAIFAVTGSADTSSTNVPTASVSAITGNNAGKGVILGGDGSIQGIRNNTLTIGGNTTGGIVLAPLNGGSGSTVTFNANTLALGGTNTVISNTGANTLTINSGSTGNINFFSSSNTLSSGGNLTLAGTITLPNSNTITGVANFAQFSNGVSVGGGTTYFINQNTSSLNSLQLAGNLYMPVSGGIADFWQLASNVIAPSNLANDLAIGGNATSSALFQIFAKTVGGTPTIGGTASTSGNLTFRNSATKVGILNGGSLGFYTSNGGDTNLTNTNPSLFITNAANGTAGNVGIGTNTPLTALDVRSTLTATNVASISGATGKALLQLDQSGVGDLLTASTAGLTRFTIANDGTIRNSLNPSLDNTYDLGTAALRWRNLNAVNIYASNIFVPVTSGTFGFWQLASNVIAPSNLANDLAIGGNATSSAAWQVFAQTVGGTAAVAGTATTSGNLAFRGSGTRVDLLNNANLGIYYSVGGNAGLSANPAFYVKNNGNIGINTANPLAQLDISGNASISGNLTFSGANRVIAAAALNNLILGDSNTSNIYFNPAGATVVGTTGIVPLNQTALQVQKNGLGNAIEVLNQLGLGDIWTASASGVTQAILGNTGIFTASRFVDLANSDYFLDPAAAGQSLTTLGSVAVATNSASYKLHVVGDAEIGLDAGNWGGGFSAYSNRRQIQINNKSGSTLTNYQQKVVIDTATLISRGRMLSTCADARFSDTDGSTNLNYWLEPNTCNTGATTFWIKVPTIPGGQIKTIYFYYTNAAATAPSNQTTNTFIRDLDSVQAAYRFDEQSIPSSAVNNVPYQSGSPTIYNTGALADFSGNNNNATSSAGSVTAGKFFNARSFNGSSEFVEIQDSASLRVSNSYSIATWFKTTTSSSSNIFRKDTVSATGTRYLYGLNVNDNTANKACFQFYNGTSNNYVCTTTSVNDGNWHYIVGVMNASNQMSIYLDGSLQAGPTAIGAGGVGVPTGPLDIGANPGTSGGSRGGYFNGSVDEVRIYNKILSSAEITDLYGLGGNDYGYVTPNYPNRELIGAYTAVPPTTNVLQEEGVNQQIPTFYVQNTTGDIGVGTNTIASTSAKLTVAGGGNFGTYDATTFGLSNYQYRQRITVDNTGTSSALLQYQTQVIVDTQSLINAGKMRSDCGDMRFTDNDGSTSLNYWIETACNSPTTIVWVKIPSIPAATTKYIYLYYGNPTSTTASSISNTMISGGLAGMVYTLNTGGTTPTLATLQGAAASNSAGAQYLFRCSVFTTSTNFSTTGTSGTYPWETCTGSATTIATKWLGWYSGTAGNSTTLAITTDDGGSLFVGGAGNPNGSNWAVPNSLTSVGQWIPQGAVEKVATFTMPTAGAARIEYDYEDTGGSWTQRLGSAASTYPVSNANLYTKQFNAVEPQTTLSSEQDASQVMTNLYVDTKTGNVGVGTSNPTALLSLPQNGRIMDFRSDRLVRMGAGQGNGSDSDNVGLNWTYNTYFDLSKNSAGWVGRDINDITNLMRFANRTNNTAFELWTAPTASAGASPSWSNLLTVNNNGGIGIGTLTTPDSLTINGRGGTNGYGQLRMIDGNYGAIFRNDGSSTYILLTNSGDQYGQWNSLRPFAIDNSTGYVTSTTRVGIGGTPSYPLDVTSTITSNVSQQFGYLSTTAAGAVNTSTGNVSVSIHTSGRIWSGGEINVLSDARLKNLIDTISPGQALDAINHLNPLHFVWKPETNRGNFVDAGFFAQDVAQYIPEAVLIHQSDLLPDERNLDYNMMTTYAIAAIKGLNEKISTDEAKLQNLSLTTTGNLAIAEDQSSPTGGYKVINGTTNTVITQLAGLAELVVAHIKSGFIETQKLTTQQFAIATTNISIAGQSLSDYIISVVRSSDLIANGTISPIAEVDQIHANVISPLAQNSLISLKLDQNKLEIFNDHNASGSAVATIDNIGNASFSGSLNTKNLAVNSDASISGTLRAHKIVADEIEGLQATVSTLAAQNITNVTNMYFATSSSGINSGQNTSGQNIASNLSNQLPGGFTNLASFSAYLAYVPQLQADTATFMQGLTSYGPTTLSDTSIAGQLAVGGQLIINENSINVLGTDFYVQPLKQGGVDFLAGAMKIGTDGNITFNGNAVFNGTIAAHLISPLSNQDLDVVLANKTDDITNQTTSQKLSIKNASGSAVVAFNNTGDIIASGTGTFAKLNLSLVQPAYALSSTEVVATGSAGTTQINIHQKEITINNPLVTEKSLIYITPVGDTRGQIPVLLRQVPGESFTVGVSEFTSNPIQFNWLIVN